jgi:lipopolysaccharide biosynthesis glycosyltransferase
MYIDIAFSLNKTIYLSLLVLINSIISNTSNPKNIRFNIVVPPREKQFFQEKINLAFPKENIIFRIHEYTPPEYVCRYLDLKFKETNEAKRGSRFMQYSRLFLKEVFGDLRKTIYFDTDIVVLGDVVNLYKGVDRFQSDRVLAAVAHCFPAFFYFSNPLAIASELREIKRTFNSGVLLTDYSLWGENIYSTLERYLDLDRRHSYRLFNLGDETVLNLMFKNFIPLDSSWNRCGYGNTRLLTHLIRCDLRSTNAIHWSGGHHKPWRSPNIIYSKFWHRYNRFSNIAVPNRMKYSRTFAE